MKKVAIIRRNQRILGVGAIAISILAMVINAKGLVPFSVALDGLVIYLMVAMSKRINKLKKKEALMHKKDRAKKTALNKCLVALRHLEMAYERAGISTEISENYVLSDLYQILNFKCSNATDYAMLEEEAKNRTQQLVAREMPASPKVEKIEKVYAVNKVDSMVERRIGRCLKLLGLSEDTRNMVEIERAYEKLKLKYSGSTAEKLRAELRLIEEAREEIASLIG